MLSDGHWQSLAAFNRTRYNGAVARKVEVGRRLANRNNNNNGSTEFECGKLIYRRI